MSQIVVFSTGFLGRVYPTTDNYILRFTPYFYRTHHQSEVDLVLVKGNTPIASIEIKYTNAPKISKGNILSTEDLETPNKFIITHSSDSFHTKEGFLVCNLSDFIKNHLPKL